MEARTRPGSALTRLGCVRGAAGHAASVALMVYTQSVPPGVYVFPSMGARAHAKPYPNVGSLPGLCVTRGIKFPPATCKHRRRMIRDDASDSAAIRTTIHTHSPRHDWTQSPRETQVAAALDR
ncbi:hypothetical protein C8J57DRAFT_1732784 [Mycena rebaudengoi]|nr:hypothetical protein C8J57DRAFT_1732784 [Mycena rebaudengoi]